jgi:Domain of unknown function (DUF4402)
MSKFLRIALAASAAALIAAPAAAAPTSVSNGPVTARAQILKPLTLTKVSNMDFGSIVDQSGGTVTMDTAGNLTCTSGLTCTATGTPAQYNVNGSNNQVVNITKPAVTLTNTTNPGTPLTLVLSGPSQVTLPNSGTAGTNFNLGGSIAVGAATNDGVYTGDLNVTVDYN